MAVTYRWGIEPDVHVRIVFPENDTWLYNQWGFEQFSCIGLQKGSFHRDSKRIAEELAQSEIYVVADDDHLILGSDFVARGVSTLQAHPEYGMVSGASIIEHQHYLEFPEPIVDLHAIGCPYFVRKGIFQQFPEGPADQYDGILSDVLASKGLKTGIMPQVRYNHLGFGYSQVSPAHWSGPK